MDKRSDKETELFAGLDSMDRDEGCSVFGINTTEGTFEPLFESKSEKHAQTMVDKLCGHCNQDCTDWKRQINICYRIVSHEKN